MNKLLPVLILLLAGCQARESVEQNQTIALPDDLLADLGNGNAGEDMARVQALIDRAMPAALPEAAKAVYRNIRPGVGGSACGEVATPAPNGKAGPYRHFVISPDAVAVIGTDSGVRFNDPSDFLADAWIRWCATPEELKLVEGQIDQGPPLTTPSEPDIPLPPIVEEPLPPPSIRQAPPRQTAAAEPPPAQIDSFSKSVSRPQ